jgi:tetratricopeptide (TPR) repeat protein
MDKLEEAKKLFFDGINSLQKKEYPKAEQEFLKSLELIPGKDSVLSNLSAAQIGLKKYEMARESSLKSILIKPENPTALLNLGVIEQEEFNHEEAIKYFDKAISCSKNFSQAWNNKAISLS